jgi:hypothetical protein
MPITINGTGSIAGLSYGGLPDGCVTGADIGTRTIPENRLALGVIKSDKQGTTFFGTPTGPFCQYIHLPDNMKHITLMFHEVGQNTITPQHMLVTLGDSNNIFPTNEFRSQVTIINTGAATAASTNGFIMHWPEQGAKSSGTMTLSCMGESSSGGTGQIWTASGTFAWKGSTNSMIVSGGSIKLPGFSYVNRVQINNFDTGCVNIITTDNI